MPANQPGSDSDAVVHVVPALLSSSHMLMSGVEQSTTSGILAFYKYTLLPQQILIQLESNPVTQNVLLSRHYKSRWGHQAGEFLFSRNTPLL